MRRICPGMIVALATVYLNAQDLQELTRKITEFTLPNGLHFVIAERRTAPVVSFVTYVRAGSVDDPGGQAGMAHMFEHLAFKGTESIGTKDWAAEKKALDAVEEAYDRLEAEQNKGPNADLGKVGAAEIMLKRAIEQAQALAQPAEFARIIQENGGVGLTAATTADATTYSCSLPSNRIELWFLMESQRLLRPVFRDFYGERDVVAEEYRERLEANVQGRIAQALLTNALAAHPYRRPEMGWPSELAGLRRGQAKEFFDRYYIPGNMTIAIAGDVDPVDAKKLAERYFAPIPSRPLPGPVRTVEPRQWGPKTALVESGQNILMVGYRRPDHFDPDDLALDVIQYILTGGRTGWLYKELVRDKPIAVAAQAVSTFPGARYPGLFVIRLMPSPGHTIQENQSALDGALNRLIDEPVDAATLSTAKLQLRAAVIQRLGGNASLATLLATYHSAFGNWRKMLTDIDALQKVTAQDLQRAARKYFTLSNRTVALSTPPPQQITAPPAKGVRR